MTWACSSWKRWVGGRKIGSLIPSISLWLAMESSLYMSFVALVLSVVALLVVLWIGIKGRKKPLTGDESLTILKREQAEGGLEARLNAALAGLEFLEKYFKIEKGINEYGSRITEAYDEFITRVEDEFITLEQRKIVGKEYALRASMLLFSLMMARVYLQVVGPRDSLPMIEQYIERAKRLS